MEQPPQSVSPDKPKKKETKSDLIAHATIEEYLRAHAKPNGGLKSFFHSNLFVALLLWALSQAVIIGGVVISFYFKTGQLSEWKGSIDGIIKRMDEQGTYHGRYADERQDSQIVAHDVIIRKLQDDTKHLEVIESEHRRLTKDVDDLRNAKK